MGEVDTLDGDLVGKRVGFPVTTLFVACVGRVGAEVGENVPPFFVGSNVGELVVVVGVKEGALVGSVGDLVGFCVGRGVVGVFVGVAVVMVGAPVGEIVSDWRIGP